ncbi:hypothetical protein GUJ93_ZPchr0002g24406 [Zizania palustris]|uniref:Uncharacterized protein n=1 Tax=Zizania palustris TaxID=103762 RepID=A0A8J5RZ38_ZIZPA|nr:hypothetical protein GUJ93_ZPchr0002g24406 [Zizania palustris]
MMMNVAFFDEDNPIMEWLSNSRSESRPILDEYDDDDDWNTPGGFLIDELQMEAEEVIVFKRKHQFGTKDANKKGKVRLEEDDLLEEDDYIGGETEESSLTSENGGNDMDEDIFDANKSFGGVSRQDGDGASGSDGTTNCSNDRV